MMYVVYKDESLSKKEFTLFNGFQSVEKSEFELNILATIFNYLNEGTLIEAPELIPDTVSLWISGILL